jgi:hypothetical protein
MKSSDFAFHAGLLVQRSVDIAQVICRAVPRVSEDIVCANTGLPILGVFGKLVWPKFPVCLPNPAIHRSGGRHPSGPARNPISSEPHLRSHQEPRDLVSPQTRIAQDGDLIRLLPPGRSREGRY